MCGGMASLTEADDGRDPTWEDDWVGRTSGGTFSTAWLMSMGRHDELRLRGRRARLDAVVDEESVDAAEEGREGTALGICGFTSYGSVATAASCEEDAYRHRWMWSATYPYSPIQSQPWAWCLQRSLQERISRTRRMSMITIEIVVYCRQSGQRPSRRANLTHRKQYGPCPHG